MVNTTPKISIIGVGLSDIYIAICVARKKRKFLGQDKFFL